MCFQLWQHVLRVKKRVLIFHFKKASLNLKTDKYTDIWSTKQIQIMALLLCCIRSYVPKHLILYIQAVIHIPPFRWLVLSWNHTGDKVPIIDLFGLLQYRNKWLCLLWWICSVFRSVFSKPLGVSVCPEVGQGFCWVRSGIKALI